MITGSIAELNSEMLISYPEGISLIEADAMHHLIRLYAFGILIQSTIFASILSIKQMISFDFIRVFWHPTCIKPRGSIPVIITNE